MFTGGFVDDDYDDVSEAEEELLETPLTATGVPGVSAAAAAASAPAGSEAQIAPGAGGAEAAAATEVVAPLAAASPGAPVELPQIAPGIFKLSAIFAPQPFDDVPPPRRPPAPPPPRREPVEPPASGFELFLSRPEAETAVDANSRDTDAAAAAAAEEAKRLVRSDPWARAEALVLGSALLRVVAEEEADERAAAAARAKEEEAAAEAELQSALEEEEEADVEMGESSLVPYRASATDEPWFDDCNGTEGAEEFTEEEAKDPRLKPPLLTFSSASAGDAATLPALIPPRAAARASDPISVAAGAPSSSVGVGRIPDGGAEDPWAFGAEPLRFLLGAPAAFDAHGSRPTVAGLVSSGSAPTAPAAAEEILSDVRYSRVAQDTWEASIQWGGADDASEEGAEEEEEAVAANGCAIVTGASTAATTNTAAKGFATLAASSSFSTAKALSTAAAASVAPGTRAARERLPGTAVFRTGARVYRDEAGTEPSNVRVEDATWLGGIVWDDQIPPWGRYARTPGSPAPIYIYVHICT